MLSNSLCRALAFTLEYVLSWRNYSRVAGGSLRAELKAVAEMVWKHIAPEDEHCTLYSYTYRHMQLDRVECIRLAEGNEVKELVQIYIVQLYRSKKGARAT